MAYIKAPDFKKSFGVNAEEAAQNVGNKFKIRMRNTLPRCAKAALLARYMRRLENNPNTKPSGEGDHNIFTRALADLNKTPRLVNVDLMFPVKVATLDNGDAIIVNGSIFGTSSVDVK